MDRDEPPQQRFDGIRQQRERRKSVLKRAQIVLAGGGAFDCVVEDLSATGAKVRLANLAPVPEAFALRFPDGGSHAARRRWALGTAVGMAFEEGCGPEAETERRHLLEAVRRASGAADPAAGLALLRGVWFLGDEHLRGAAADLELAHVRFRAALAPHLASRG